MSVTNDSVRDRIQQATSELTPLHLAIILLLVAAAGFTVLFLQDPLAHDSLHNFRHSLGVTCH